jgi:hypothetical protein
MGTMALRRFRTVPPTLTHTDHAVISASECDERSMLADIFNCVLEVFARITIQLLEELVIPTYEWCSAVLFRDS